MGGLENLARDAICVSCFDISVVSLFSLAAPIAGSRQYKYGKRGDCRYQLSAEVLSIVIS